LKGRKQELARSKLTSQTRILQPSQSIWNPLPLSQKILQLQHVILEGGDLLGDDDELGVAVFKEVASVSTNNNERGRRNEARKDELLEHVSLELRSVEEGYRVSLGSKRRG